MELFSIDTSTEQEQKHIQLLLTTELLTYWIHFTSFQLHWRGYELAENQHLTECDKNEMLLEYQFFDQLYHRFLLYLPQDKSNVQFQTYFSMPIDYILKIYEELEDYIQYCHLYNEDELLEVSEHYKSSFHSILDEQSPTIH